MNETATETSARRVMKQAFARTFTTWPSHWPAPFPETPTSRAQRMAKEVRDRNPQMQVKKIEGGLY